MLTFSRNYVRNSHRVKNFVREIFSSDFCLNKGQIMRFYTYSIIFSLVLLTGCTKPLTNVMNDHGFQRFQPPHKMIEPGTLIVIERVDEKVTSVIPVCWRPQAFPTLRAPTSNPTAEVELKGKIGDTFILETAYLERVKAKYPDIDEIELRLSNPAVLEYPDAKLYAGIASRSQPCKDAVAAREAKGDRVYTVLRVLRADAIYEIIGKDRTRHKEGKLPQKILEDLKAELGGSSISTFSQTIKGSSLHWGLQPDIIAFESIPKSEPVDATVPDTEPADAASPDVSPESAPADDVGLSEALKAPRLSDIERKSIIQGVAILQYGKSDADRLK